MKKTNVKVLGAILSIFALSASAVGNGPNWGNPYDLWIGGVWYQSNGTAGYSHNGTHGNTVSGPNSSVCNSRLQDAISSHSGEPQTSITNCYLKTTVLFEPQIAAPINGGGSNSGNPIWDELVELEVMHNLESFQQEIQSLEKKYNIEGFRAKYEALHQRSITGSKAERKTVR